MYCWSTGVGFEKNSYDFGPSKMCCTADQHKNSTPSLDPPPTISISNYQLFISYSLTPPVIANIVFASPLPHPSATNVIYG